MIVLFTDFGVAGPYVGQMTAVLRRSAPDADVINLFADAPPFNPKAAAYLLTAYVTEFPEGTVFLCVVDPGVGSGRRPLAVRVDGRWLVGPDNGLFELVIRRAAGEARCWQITWAPPHLSRSFHGRDLFAPVAAHLSRDPVPPGNEIPNEAVRRPAWPDDLPAVVYIDGFGNAITGIRASSLPSDAIVEIAGRRIVHAEVFSKVPKRGLFWYGNANGLVELAANRASAALSLAVGIGDTVTIKGAPLTLAAATGAG